MKKKTFVLSFVIMLIFVVFPSSVFAQAATMSLSPASGTLRKGCPFSVSVNVDTGGIQTDGTDVILLYDTSRFTGQSITNGSIYPDYPGNNIDNSAGKILITGLASVSTPFTGTGILATVNFTVQSSAPDGATQINFDFDPQNKAKTTDSNVVQTTTVVDVLNSVTNGSYVIGTGACDAVSTSPPRGAPSTPSASVPEKIPVKTLPEGGTQEFTYTLAIVGGVLTVLGLLGLAVL